MYKNSLFVLDIGLTSKESSETCSTCLKEITKHYQTITMEYYCTNHIVLVLKHNSNWTKVFTRLSIPDNNPARIFGLLATGIWS